MEIVKQGESFVLKDTTDVFTINGHINRDINGSISIDCNVCKSENEYIGDIYYRLYVESNSVNFGVNCPEDYRKTFLNYAEDLIASALEQLNSNN